VRGNAQNWRELGGAPGLYNANGRSTVKGIDGESFRMLNSFWGKDDHEVFLLQDRRRAEDARFIYTVTDNNTINHILDTFFCPG
jgi:hypothetical protein